MRFRKLGFLLVLSALLTILLTAAIALGGTVGKISGVVTDEKGEAIPGASVRIEGTSMGAAANFDGSYVILNVSPGTYTLSAQTVGFNKLTVQNVQVQADVTTEQKFKLTSSAIVVQDQTVIAQKPSIDKYISTNESKMSKDQLKTMPVSNVQDVLKTITGFVKTGGVFHARGGRAGEIAYVIDGIEIKDPQGSYGANYKQNVDVSATDVEELSVLKGNYDAEYGGANSAIINIVRKEGNVRTTSGRIEYLTDDLGFRQLNKYSFNSDRLEWNLSGPVPGLSDQLFPAVGLKWPGEKMAYFLSFSTDKSNTSLDYNNFPSANSKIDYGYEKFMGIEIPNRRSNQYAGSGKLTWKMDQNAKYRLSFNYWKQWQRFTGFTWPFIFSPSTAPTIHEGKEIYGVSFQFSPNFLKNTYGELKVNRFIQTYEQDPGTRHPNDFLIRDYNESYTDANRNGKWDSAEPFVDTNHDGYFGEPFTDNDGDRHYTAGIDLWIPYRFDPTDSLTLDTIWVDDLNHNGVYDTDIGHPYSDLNGNGKWDDAEVIGGDRSFYDANNNGIFDKAGDPFVDWNHDGRWTSAEPYADNNGDGHYNNGEPFTDLNGNGEWTPAEPFDDLNHNGVYDNGDCAYTDSLGRGNGVFDMQLRPMTGPTANDVAEPFTDGDVIIGEPYIDANGDGTFDGPPNDLNGSDVFLGAWDLNHNGRWDGPTDPYVEGVPYRDLNNNGKYDAPNARYDYGEPYTDINGNGVHDTRDGFWDYGYDQWALYSTQRSEVNTFQLNLTSQVSKQHELKSGLEFKTLKLNMGEIQYPDAIYDQPSDGGPWAERGTFRDFYTRQPKQGSFYVRDKMEYGEMIADLGFRYEFYLQANEVKGTGFSSSNLSGKDVYDSRNKFSPRISFSFPVTDKAKMYFNYGHFYQLPDLVNLFRRPTQSSSAFGIIGNPNLDFQKTIQYELGLQYSIAAGYVLDVSGFYKDYYGLLNLVNETYGPITTQTYSNVDYARTRGIETKLEKRYGSFFAGSIEYQYSYAFGKSSSETSDYYARFYRLEIPIQERPLDWDIRHQLTLNGDLRATKGQHPKFGIITFPDDWSFNFIWQFKTGRPFTPDSRYPGLILIGKENPLPNSMRMANYSTVDVRFDKNFQLWKLNYTATLKLLNAFDTRNINSVYTTTGLAYTNQNNNGQILTGLASDANPANYDAGRQIQFGMSLNF